MSSSAHGDCSVRDVPSDSDHADCSVRLVPDEGTMSSADCPEFAGCDDQSQLVDGAPVPPLEELRRTQRQRTYDASGAGAARELRRRQLKEMGL